jgi:hypothetical protein
LPKNGKILQVSLKFVVPLGGSFHFKARFAIPTANF